MLRVPSFVVPAAAAVAVAAIAAPFPSANLLLSPAVAEAPSLSVNVLLSPFASVTLFHAVFAFAIPSPVEDEHPLGVGLVMVATASCVLSVVGCLSLFVIVLLVRAAVEVPFLFACEQLSTACLGNPTVDVADVVLDFSVVAAVEDGFPAVGFLADGVQLQMVTERCVNRVGVGDYLERYFVVLEEQLSDDSIAIGTIQDCSWINRAPFGFVKQMATSMG